MIIDVTYACNMGYSHCMSDCTPDGLHMPIQTFRDSLNFLQTYKIPTWNFSGGEMFEHPQIMESSNGPSWHLDVPYVLSRMGVN